MKTRKNKRESTCAGMRAKRSLMMRLVLQAQESEKRQNELVKWTERNFPVRSRNQGYQACAIPVRLLELE